jgi:hypothetical protein
MQQFSQQPEPPKKSFMEQVGWQLILIVVAFITGILGTVIVGIWQGTTHIIDFSWVVLFLVLIISGIVAYFVWYSIKTRKQILEQYIKDTAEVKRDNQTFKNDIRQMREDETRGWHEWAIPFSAQVDKEHRERTEVLKRQCMEAIHDAGLRLDVNMKNSMSLYKTAQETAGIIIDQYREQLIHEMRRMDAIEEHFRSEHLPRNEE